MIRFQRPPEPPGFAKGTPRPRARGRFDETVWKPHKAAFSQAQHGKCGYCESYVAGTQDADVEHYAPKHAVADVIDDPTTWGDEARPGVANLRTGSRATIERSKTGYWWRAYDWSNYLFACTVCNRKYKDTVFPLAPTPPKRWRPTKRDRQHAPLLLNCYDDEAPWRQFETNRAAEPRSPRAASTATRCASAAIASSGPLTASSMRSSRHRPTRARARTPGAI